MTQRVMMDRPGYDDPMWKYVVASRIEPYIPYIRSWWLNVESYRVNGTGVYEMQNAIPGLYVRFTKSASKSPIKGVQAFPFIPTGYLQLSGIQGGASKMVERVCLSGLVIDEFTVIEKHNLPSTYQQGQFVAVIPTDVYNEARSLGVWVYFTNGELVDIASGNITETIKQKVLRRI